MRFWDYVIAAIRTVHPHIGEQTLTLLHEPQLLPIETILSSLINELSVQPDLLTLLLDKVSHKGLSHAIFTLRVYNRSH